MAQTEIPLALPSIGDEEKELAMEILDSNWLTHGPYNKKLEDQFRELLGVPHAICMNSCTSALEIAIKAPGIKGEVIVPSFTWVASANAVVTGGATPVFCDSDLQTRNVTAKQIEPLITERTEAVMIVHYGGQCCQMDDILELCEKHDLLLIEDSAETIGGTWKGRQAGSWGIGCFSFFPTKNITTGEGGMFTCSDSSLFETVKPMMAHGIGSQTIEREEGEIQPWERIAGMPGHNFRMSNLLAGIGYIQMSKLERMNEARRKRAAQYNELLRGKNLPVEMPYEHPEARHVYQMYTIRVDHEHRDALVTYLRERGIGASVHFTPPVHLHPYYKSNYPARRKLENAEMLSRTLVTLPIYPDMPESYVDLVVDSITSYFASSHE